MQASVEVALRQTDDVPVGSRLLAGRFGRGASCTSLVVDERLHVFFPAELPGVLPLVSPNPDRVAQGGMKGSFWPALEGQPPYGGLSDKARS